MREPAHLHLGFCNPAGLLSLELSMVPKPPVSRLQASHSICCQGHSLPGSPSASCLCPPPPWNCSQTLPGLRPSPGPRPRPERRAFSCTLPPSPSGLPPASSLGSRRAGPQPWAPAVRSANPEHRLALPCTPGSSQVAGISSNCHTPTVPRGRIHLRPGHTCWQWPPHRLPGPLQPVDPLGRCGTPHEP